MDKKESQMNPIANIDYGSKELQRNPIANIDFGSINSEMIDKKNSIEEQIKIPKRNIYYWIKRIIFVFIIVIILYAFYQIGYMKGKESMPEGLSENSSDNKKENLEEKTEEKEGENLEEKAEEKEEEKDGLKIAICAVGKDENKYVNEWVDYYRGFGINKIFLYDNNYPNETEKFITVLKKDVANNFVEITDWTHIQNVSFQVTAYNDCYKKHKDEYDWFWITDIDEYLYLKHNKTIREYLNDPIFEKCQGIRISWIIHGDNGLVYYENKPIQERFKQPGKNEFLKMQGKSFVRGHLDNPKISMHVHRPLNLDYCCDNKGDEIQTTSQDQEFNVDNAFIKHYFTKTADEFVNKIYKFKYGRSGKTDFAGYIDKKVKEFFIVNDKTPEKIEIFEKGLDINLDFLKNNSSLSS